MKGPVPAVSGGTAAITNQAAPSGAQGQGSVSKDRHHELSPLRAHAFGYFPAWTVYSAVDARSLSP
jgi:hypothetical protein